jgi:hypothetical protein
VLLASLAAAAWDNHIFILSHRHRQQQQHSQL